MHKYVLRRHLKGAVDAVIATKRMGSSRLMGLFASASETPTSGAATEATPAAEAPAAATTAGSGYLPQTSPPSSPPMT